MDIFSIYLAVSFFTFLIWAILWSKDGGLNVLIKLSFVAMALFALLVAWKIHVKEQIKYIELEKAKIELMKGQLKAQLPTNTVEDNQ